MAVAAAVVAAAAVVEVATATSEFDLAGADDDLDPLCGPGRYGIPKTNRSAIWTPASPRRGRAPECRPRARVLSGNAMAKKSKMSVLKRQRERKKAEKAAMKREERGQKERSESDVATADDLEGYGLGSESSGDADEGEAKD